MNAPSGELALVFTDIEGSTGLWEQLGGAFSRALAVHDGVMRAAIARWGGYEVKTEGDAFMVAFHEPAAALRFCLDAQLALRDADWPPEVLALLPSEGQLFRGPRVRMGVHVGEPERRVDPLSGRMDYFGPPVNRAARIAAAGNGGQVIISGAVLAKIGELRGEVALAELGVHRLRGLNAPETLVLALPKALAGRRFGPLRVEEIRRTNLRALPRPLVGRAAEQAELLRRLDAGQRILTVTGPGGIGKSRLLHRCVELWYGRDEQRSAWWVELDGCEDDGAVIGAVASALGVPLSPGLSTRASGQVLSAALAHLTRSTRGPALLVADGVDRALATAGPLLAGLVADTPGLALLASSRERMRVNGEGVFELGPLASADAVALFRSLAPEITADEALFVRIVERLDGIPLAIDLAARRLDMLDPEQLLQRLDRSLEVLTGGARDGAARQRTLRATIEWSWRLLSPHERTALAWCSVFGGSFTPEMAEAVLRLPADAPPVLDVLQDLRDKSLLRAARCEEIRGERRLDLFKSVREWAAEQLQLSGERAFAEASYKAHVVQALLPLSAPLISLMPTASIRRLWVEREHLIAVHRAARTSDPQTSVRVALAAAPVLALRGSTAALMALLDAALTDADDSLRPWVLIARSNTLREQGHLEEAKAGLMAALSLLTGIASGERTWTGGGPLSSRDRRAELFVRFCIANLFLTRGQLPQAEELYRVVLRDAQTLNEEGLRAMILANQGAVGVHAGRYEDAERCLNEAVRIERGLGLARAEAVALTNLATLCVFLRRPGTDALLREAESAHLALGDIGASAIALSHQALLRFDAGAPAEAVPMLEEALERFRAAGQPRGEGLTLAQLGRMDRLLGEDARAEARWRESLALLSRASAHRNVGYVEASLGALLADRGRPDEARTLLESGRERLEKVGDPLGVLTAELCHAHLERAEGRTDAARARVARAHEGTPPPAERSVDLRIALAIFEVSGG